MHLDGNLLSYAIGHGWKQRDPGLSAAAISVPAAAAGEEGSDVLCADDKMYCNGFFDHVVEVFSDAANALVWAAADNGKRIKAFRCAEIETTGSCGCVELLRFACFAEFMCCWVCVCLYVCCG
jgi:hypothetical protein